MHPVANTAQAADEDMGEAKEVKMNHALKAEAGVEEGGRVGKSLALKILQLSPKEIRQLQKQTIYRKRILSESRRTYLEQYETIYSLNDPIRILLAIRYEDVSQLL